MGKVQLLLNHWLYPFIIHTKQQQCIEVQFRLENTYIQLRVWLQRKNKNDWIVLRERRKYIFNPSRLFFRFWGILLLSGEYSVRGDGGAVPDGNGNKPGGGGGDAASVVGGGSTVYGAAYPPIYSTNPAPAPPSTIGGGVSSRPGSSASGKQERLIIYRT